LIKDLENPLRRAFLLKAVEDHKPDNENLLNALDIFYMTFQQANFKGKPKSMFKPTKKQNEKPYFYETVPIPDPITGEKVMTKIKVYI